MRVIGTILVKEFRQIGRDRRMIPLILVSPIFQLLILGYAATLDVGEVRTVVCDLDRSAASRELVSRLEAPGIFRVVARVDRNGAVDDEIRTGRAQIGLVIPRGFATDLDAARSLLLVVDGTQATVATIALNHARETLLRFLRESLSGMTSPPGASWSDGPARFDRVAPPTPPSPGHLLSLPDIRLQPRVFYNEEMRSADFMVPAVLAMVLMVMTVVLSSMNLVREKESGTIEQLIVTPVRPVELLVGKLAPFVVIGLVDVVIVLGVALFWFEVPLRGSIPFLFGVSLLFLMSTLGLGLLVSIASATQQQAMMTAIFFVMVPSILLSGFIFPIENMPRLFQEVSRAIPMRYYLAVVRGVFLKGTGPAVHWPDVAALLALGLAILGVSVALFRKRVD